MLVSCHAMIHTVPEQLSGTSGEVMSAAEQRACKKKQSRTIIECTHHPPSINAQLGLARTDHDPKQAVPGSWVAVCRTMVDASRGSLYSVVSSRTK